MEIVVDPFLKTGVPQSVTRRQFKRGLLHLGLLDQAEVLIAASGDRVLQIDYADALDFERGNQLIAGMGALMGKTEAEIDDLFRLAATL